MYIHFTTFCCTCIARSCARGSLDSPTGTFVPIIFIMTTILLLGSSHICKFENFIKKKGTVNPFQHVTPRPWVKFLGISGGRMNKPGHIRQFEDAVQIIRPDKIIIQIGGNDLDLKTFWTQTVCRDVNNSLPISLTNLSPRQENLSINLVSNISLLLYFGHVMTLVTVIYNDCVISVNRLLKCKLSGILNIHYRKLKGLKHSNNLFIDGVHLSTAP